MLVKMLSTRKGSPNGTDGDVFRGPSVRDSRRIARCVHSGRAGARPPSPFVREKMMAKPQMPLPIQPPRDIQPPKGRWKKLLEQENPPTVKAMPRPVETLSDYKGRPLPWLLRLLGFREHPHMEKLLQELKAKNPKQTSPRSFWPKLTSWRSIRAMNFSTWRKSKA